MHKQLIWSYAILVTDKVVFFEIASNTTLYGERVIELQVSPCLGFSGVLLQYT